MIGPGWPVDRGPADRAAGTTHGDALRACLGCPPAAKGMLVARSDPIPPAQAASRARDAVRIGGDLESLISVLEDELAVADADAVARVQRLRPGEQLLVEAGA